MFNTRDIKLQEVANDNSAITRYPNRKIAAVHRPGMLWLRIQRGSIWKGAGPMHR
jgi:hypothetical protein